MGQMVRSAYRDLREGLGGLTAQQRSRDGILFLSNKDTEVDSFFHSAAPLSLLLYYSTSS